MLDITIKILDKFDVIEQDWLDLLNRIERKVFFQTLTWNKLLWKHFKRKEEELCLIAFYSVGKLVGIVPLEKKTCSIGEDRVSILTLIGEENQFQNFIFDESYTEEIFEILTDYLCKNKEFWDLLVLPNLQKRTTVDKVMDYQLMRSGLEFTIDFSNEIYSIDLTTDEECPIEKNISKKGIPFKGYLGSDDIEENIVAIDKEKDDMNSFLMFNWRCWDTMNENGFISGHRYKKFHKELMYESKNMLSLRLYYRKDKAIAYQYAYDFNYERFLFFLDIDPKYKNTSTYTSILNDCMRDAKLKGLKRVNLMFDTNQKSYNSNSFAHNQSYIISHTTNILKKYLDYKKQLRTNLMESRLKHILKKMTIEDAMPLTWINEKMRIIILSPHYDDEVISCGGVLSQHYKRGDQCEIIYFTNGNASKYSGLTQGELSRVRKNEAERGLRLIGDFKTYHLGYFDGFLRLDDNTVNDLKQILKKNEYHRIYLPNPLDAQSDHKMVGLILLDVLEGINFNGELYIYEFWNPLSNPTHWVELKEGEKLKEKALEEHKTQLKYTDYVRLMKTLNSSRGDYLNMGSCEVFQSVSKDELKSIYKSNKIF